MSAKLCQQLDAGVNHGKSAYRIIDLNNSGKVKSRELSHGFRKPLTSSVWPSPLTQWSFLFALSGAAFDADGALKVQVYFVFDVIVFVIILEVLLKHCTLRIATSRNPPNLPPQRKR